MNININLKFIAEIFLAVFLIATSTVLLWQWTVSPKLLGVSALISGICYLLSVVFTQSVVVGRKAPPPAA